MSYKKNGQAKVLSEKQIIDLQQKGFTKTRDKALFALCFYTACRISEARKIYLVDVFEGEKVREQILLRKCNTKGKMGTRIIPTHPSLRQYLEEYYQDSLKLWDLKQKIGHWSPQNLNQNHQIEVEIKYICPYCGGEQFRKDGWYQGDNGQVQKYFCKKCHHYAHEHKLKPHPHPSKKTYEVYGVENSGNYGFLGENPQNPYLFPGLKGKGCLSVGQCLTIFNQAFSCLEVAGATSHSCRRTSLTIMHKKGTILRVLQEISGHKDLGSLQRYLEVTPEQTRAAVNLLD